MIIIYQLILINIKDDLPMSHPGYGAPVDELDKICKEYRSCVKCLKETHGNDCIPDKKRYKSVFSFKKNRLF